MRTHAAGIGVALLCIAAVAPPVLADSPAADLPAGLAGHWHCTIAGAADRERYYHVRRAANGDVTTYGRMETTTRAGEPMVDFEHVRVDAGRITVESPEVTGDATASSGTLDVVAGQPSTERVALRYALDGERLTRVVTLGGKVVDDERCTRVPLPAFPSTCATPNTPPRVLHAAQPSYPADAMASRATGIVQLIVSVDEYGHVFDARVRTSDNRLLDASARNAALLSTFQPATVNCRPVAADYIFLVEFRA